MSSNRAKSARPKSSYSGTNRKEDYTTKQMLDDDFDYCITFPTKFQNETVKKQLMMTPVKMNKNHEIRSRSNHEIIPHKGLYIYIILCYVLFYDTFSYYTQYISNTVMTTKYYLVYGNW